MTPEPEVRGAVRLIISGRVQGVGFRWWTARLAETLALTGWVANLPNGRVEVVAAGPPEALQALERSAAMGPEGARVDRVEKMLIAHEMVTPNTFTIKHI